MAVLRGHEKLQADIKERNRDKNLELQTKAQEKQATATVELAIKAEAANTHSLEANRIAREALNESRKANRIARLALRETRKAGRRAWIAIAISAAALLLSVLAFLHGCRTEKSQMRKTQVTQTLHS